MLMSRAPHEIIINFVEIYVVAHRINSWAEEILIV